MTSETDADFVERIARFDAYPGFDGWRTVSIKNADLDRLFDLARRGAAAIADDQCKKEPELPHQDRRFNNAERLFGDD